MKKSLYEKIRDFYIKLGRKNVFFRFFAMIGLAFWMIIFRFLRYCKNGTKRFACVIFILCCFMVGNSFAFPVFHWDSGFISEKAEPAQIAAQDSDISLLTEQEITANDMDIIEDDDVIAGYTDAELHEMDQADKFSAEEILTENQDLLTGNAENKKTEDFKENVPAFSEDDWKLVLINKQHPVPDDYTFVLGDIKTLKGTMKCDERIIEDLLSMMRAANKDGIQLAICSPYRDLNRQEVLFNRKIEAYMDKGMSFLEAYKISSQAVTVPGASEHQIGLAIDIISDKYQILDEGFGETAGGKWLAANCAEYGFILRYPKGKEYITSIEFEPWHFRYVGKDAAKIIMNEGICLEEFWDKYL